MTDTKIQVISAAAFRFATGNATQDDRLDLATCSPEELQVFAELLRQHSRGLTNWNNHEGSW